MNFVNDNLAAVRRSKTQVVLCPSLALLLCLYVIGCGDNVRLASTEQRERFENAGPQRPTVDMDRLVNARIGGGPHCIAPGEVLELTMPTILQVVTAEEPEVAPIMTPYICRVSPKGTLTLPVVGEIEVRAKTLAEIESVVTDAYYPKYTVTRPSVFARVLEYKTIDVSVAGAVNKPGIYSLRSDKMSLVALLMEAEGIIDEGAAFIRIIHAEQEAAGNRATAIRTVYQSVEQQPEWDTGRLSSPVARHAALGEIDVQLEFSPPAAPGTRGALTVSYGGKTLLAEPLDIGSETERRAMLEKLIRKEPRISDAVVNQRLCALAELLDTGCSIRRGDNAGVEENRISVAKLDSSGFESRAWKKTVGGGTLVSTAGGDDAPRTFAAPAEASEPHEPESIVLPVKGLNIPFADVPLQDGDRVIVERFREPMFTVVGLVNKAGNFPYPPDVQYNLMHALGFAGGLDPSAEPRYATIYRLAADGTTVSVTFNVAGIAKSLDPTDALSIVLKPYDVIAVEHTPRTRAKVFWDRVFRFYVSTYIGPDDLFGDD